MLPLAERGNADAQFNLGLMFAQGHGVPQDDALAAAWYRKAADQGIADAQFDLGVMYAQGHGVAQDHARAIEWLRKAADQGYAVAQSNLGGMYEQGHGVVQDYAQALAWYRKAADQTPTRSSTSPCCNVKGPKRAEDDAQGVRLRKAADQGNADAQIDLVWIYAKGEGVAEDDGQAGECFRKAADQGYADAQNALGWMYAWRAAGRTRRLSNGTARPPDC